MDSLGALTDSRVPKPSGGDNTEAHMLALTELIARAPWEGGGNLSGYLAPRVRAV